MTVGAAPASVREAGSATRTDPGGVLAHPDIEPVVVDGPTDRREGDRALPRCLRVRSEAGDLADRDTVGPDEVDHGARRQRIEGRSDLDQSDGAGHVASTGVDPGHELLAGVAALREADRRVDQPLAELGGDGLLGSPARMRRASITHGSTTVAVGGGANGALPTRSRPTRPGSEQGASR